MPTAYPSKFNLTEKDSTFTSKVIHRKVPLEKLMRCLFRSSSNRLQFKCHLDLRSSNLMTYPPSHPLWWYLRSRLSLKSLHQLPTLIFSNNRQSKLIPRLSMWAKIMDPTQKIPQWFKSLDWGGIGLLDRQRTLRNVRLPVLLLSVPLWCLLRGQEDPRKRGSLQ